jgi:hypothetical protein
MTTLIPVVLLSFIFLSEPAVASLDPHYCDSSGRCQPYNVAHSFVRYRDMTPLQAEILERSGISDSVFTSTGSTIYEQWASDNDDHAANYLAVSRALSHLELQWPNGEKRWAIELVETVNRFEGDRIRARLNRTLFEEWVKSGGAFVFYRADGQHEKGKMKFHNGTAWGGSLHKGYDIQGFTSASKVPRLQFNYRFSDAEADIDLDGHSPMIWGFIPNPVHLTYKNSDPRQWFELLVRKLGDPGFHVRPH